MAKSFDPPGLAGPAVIVKSVQNVRWQDGLILVRAHGPHLTSTIVRAYPEPLDKRKRKNPE